MTTMTKTRKLRINQARRDNAATLDAIFGARPSIKAQAAERARLIRLLGLEPETKGDRYAATTGEMRAWLAGTEIPNYPHD